MKRLIILLTFVLVANIALAEDPVYFADANLKAAVEAALGITDPTPTDMLLLTHLNAPNDEISYLTGLEFATNLTELLLAFNNVSDITPISGLMYLTNLYLENNLIVDIPDLSALTSLTELILSNNQISNISSLSGLTNLTELYLSNNQISNTTPLADLTNLTVLYLNGNLIIDITPLSGLTNLTYLHLNSNQICDFSDLSDLTNLAFLLLSYNQITAIPDLSGLTSVGDLYLLDNQISDITGLSGLSNTTSAHLRVHLHNNQIGDISPLSDLTNLTLLYLSSNPLDCPAYGVYIPMIINNNPGINITYDPMPEPCLIWMIDRIIAFVIESVDNETLEGTGNSPDDSVGRLLDKLGRVRTHIVNETYEQACDRLSIILPKCDGLSPPPDVVRDIGNSGATEELAGMIITLMENLGCE